MSDFTLNDTLSPQAFYALLAIADKALHGYGVRSQIAHDSQSRLLLATGTVYTVLARLVKEGLAEQVEAGVDRLQISYRYRITTQGKRRLREEAVRMEQAIADARYELGERPFR